MSNLTPMMEQYLSIKEKNKDSILMFRLGDFYEMFFEDAEIASKELELTLTARNHSKGCKAKMCGVPFHSSEKYIARLVKKGYKVAICEQLEDPAVAKGVVKRDVIRVITRGTVIEGSMLDEGSNNYLCSIFESNNKVGICFCDPSTGEVYATYFTEDLQKNIETELSHYHPSEVLCSGKDTLIEKIEPFISDILESSFEKSTSSSTELDRYIDNVEKQFAEANITKLEKNSEELVLAVGLLLDYLKRTQKQGLERIITLRTYNATNYMSVDTNTQRNLELTRNMRDGEKKHTLLWVLDKTNTAMGKRLIKSWIEKPLVDIQKICTRQNAVSEIVNSIELSDKLSEVLKKIFDIERIMTRVVYGSANPKELRVLAASFATLPELCNTIKDCSSDALMYIYETFDELSDIYELIDNAIIDDPPFSAKDGGIVKDGYDSEIDLYRNLIVNSQDIMLKLENDEKEKTGIPKLKIGYNRVFGYYIEVTNAYRELVPDNYVRKQTLTSCERYITEELKDIEGKILGAKETVVNLEYVLFDGLRVKIANEVKRISKTTEKIAQLDVFNSFAKVAIKNGYCKPQVDNSGELKLINARHPVVEAVLRRDEMFVPNDVYLDLGKNRLNIITGPNMAGKSTYMRQVALITIMAQIGSFVPAKEAKLGIVDSVFTRVGASDDLARGRSTFLVEMVEVANILENATKNSLIILDEIGRGTSTFDGMSIAQAVVEYISEKIGAKTLFATHYHELTELEGKIAGVKNYNILVKKNGDDIIFLRKIVRGKADGSYGIEVAKIAGVPKSVLARSREILECLESENKTTEVCTELPLQYELCENEDNEKAKQIIEKLKSKDINTFTPIEAMNFLFELLRIAE